MEKSSYKKQRDGFNKWVWEDENGKVNRKKKKEEIGLRDEITYLG